MKYPNLISILKASLAAICMLGVCTLAMAMQSHKVVQKANASIVTAQPPAPDAYDTRLLKKLDALAAKVNGSKLGTYKGFITIKNPSDTATNITNMPFAFSRSNNDSYYKVGGAEVLNAGGVNVFVDPDRRQVMLTSQKKIQVPVSIDVNLFAEKLKNGEYKLTAKNRGSVKTITMLNELNLDCKEYSISYDTVRMQVTRIFTRAADMNDPFNYKKERVFDIKVSSVNNTAVIDRTLTAGRVVFRKGNKWKLSAKYSTYQLIIL